MKLFKALIQKFRDPKRLELSEYKEEDKRIVDIDELMAWTSSALPDAAIGEDEYGQLIIHTGLSCPRGEELTKFYVGE